MAPKTKVDLPSPKPIRAYPSVQQMVDEAIYADDHRNGSSLFAIKKYIAANFDVDIHKQATYIKKYLKRSVLSGKLLQTNGTGAQGSFKLSPTAKKEMMAAELAKKKKSISPVKPRLSANIRTSDKMKTVLKAKSKVANITQVDTKKKSENKAKNVVAVAKLTKNDVPKMTNGKGGNSKRANVKLRR